MIQYIKCNRMIQYRYTNTSTIQYHKNFIKIKIIHHRLTEVDHWVLQIHFLVLNTLHLRATHLKKLKVSTCLIQKKKSSCIEVGTKSCISPVRYGNEVLLVIKRSCFCSRYVDQTGDRSRILITELPYTMLQVIFFKVLTMCALIRALFSTPSNLPSSNCNKNGISSVSNA